MAAERQAPRRLRRHVRRNEAQHVAELQRTRLLRAAVGAIEEYGYAEASVARITAQARVSRRTFYELFDNREECVVAVLDSAVESIGAEIAASGVTNMSWRERVRSGLWVILSYLDREPMLARVCVVQALRGGTAVLDRRAEIVGRLVSIVDGGRAEGARGETCTSTTAEGVVGAAFTIVYGRLWREESAPLTELFGELMGIILLPYLGSAAARREQARPAPVQRIAPADREQKSAPEIDPLRDLPMRLTYRTARVLESVAEHPGVSNRELADYAEIPDQGQVSKLLSRLQRLELLANSGGGHLTGEPNVWTLTAKGGQVAQSISTYAGISTYAAYIDGNSKEETHP